MNPLYRTFDFINQLTGMGGEQGGAKETRFSIAAGPSSSAKPSSKVQKRPPTAQPFHTKKSESKSKSDSSKSLNVRSLQVRIH